MFTLFELALMAGFASMATIAWIAIRTGKKNIQKPQIMLGGQSDVCKDEDWRPFA